MNVASIPEIQAHLSDYVKKTRKGPVVVTRNGKPVAVLLAVTDQEEVDRLVLAHSSKFQAIVRKSRRQIKKTGGIPHDEFWKQVEAETKAAVGNGKPRRQRPKSPASETEQTR